VDNLGIELDKLMDMYARPADDGQEHDYIKQIERVCSVAGRDPEHYYEPVQEALISFNDDRTYDHQRIAAIREVLALEPTELGPNWTVVVAKICAS
jgi:hypothetical protein